MTVHKFSKILSAAVVLLLIVCSSAPAFAETVYSNSETGYRVVLEDEAFLLTESEEAALAELLSETTQYCNAAVFTIDSNPYSSTARYAEIHSDELFDGAAVCFVIDMENRYLLVDSKGSARKRITSAYCDSITDNIYTYASDGDYYTCAYRAFEQINTLLAGGRIAQPMKHINNALLALILAMLINYVIVKVLASGRKPSKQELLSSIYNRVNVENAQAVYTHQTKTYSPQSSGGGGSHSGGGGGGGGGGGHSSGGHRF